ncbi:ImmA/IrrE family metallo-endopeptidase [Mycobacterium syngnathidarum]|uniref:DNA-binding protein n=1 Tax=Mycobacterium syngnathidarum TaxID=1908205 RepID=A0A1S1K7J2_9MYCO|nr:ImmA/IrrE family metallo-endopeptidase [Mycobacterium syngnathidarum]OHU01689.1 DNA-binding protein [Mycobacterium syngnathidarum]
MVVRVDVAPGLLEWAVERAGWDGETTRRRAPKFHAWISGAERPTLKQLEKFARATHAPLGLLFLPEPPDEPVPIPDMRTIGNAVVPRPSADLLDTIYICQARQDWYRDYARDQGVPELPFVGSATVDTPVVQAAQMIRRELGFDLTDRTVFANSDDALRQLIDRIENIGVLVMVSGIVGGDTHRALAPEEFRGFALSDPYAPLLFVNGADTKAAQIFTLIHELAHIWLGGSALSDAAMASQGGVTEELWCNRVAAEVLVPLAALRGDYQGEPTEQEVTRLARRYKVSTLVILKRLFDARYLDWDEYQQLYADERDAVIALAKRRRGDRSGGQFYYTQPLRLSRHFARAVIASTYEGGTSFREAFQLLGTRRHETFTKLADEIGVG